MWHTGTSPLVPLISFVRETAAPISLYTRSKEGSLSIAPLCPVNCVATPDPDISSSRFHELLA